MSGVLQGTLNHSRLVFRHSFVNNYLTLKVISHEREFIDKFIYFSRDSRLD